MSIPDAAKIARYDDLANLVEELHDHNMTLLKAIRQTLDENGHLADGDDCTLIVLKRALEKVDAGGTACGRTEALKQMIARLVDVMERSAHEDDVRPVSSTELFAAIAAAKGMLA